MNCDQIQVNSQSSIRIEGSKTVYFDPFQIRGEAHDADVICVTHSHYDHFDPDSIEKIMKADTVLVAPASMSADLKKIAQAKEIQLVSPGDEIRIGELAVSAVPAFNKLKPFHPKHNKWVGYILSMDGTRYYVAGDTDAVKELQAVSCDVALVPIGGTYTMSAKEAAGLINAIKPAAAVPTHYGSIVGKPEDESEFRKLVSPEIRVVTKL